MPLEEQKHRIIFVTEHSNFAAKTENKAAINELSVSTYLSMPRTKANLARGDFDEIFKIIWIY